MPRRSNPREYFALPNIRLELAATEHRSGDELTGAFVIAGGPPPDTRSIELSVLWHTSGKGTEDMGVVHFQSWTQDDGTLGAMPNPFAFAVKLPETPWSYDGKLIKIHWLTRIRLRYGPAGATKELVQDAPFTLAPRNR